MRPPFDNSPGATKDAPKGHGTHVAGSLVGDTPVPALAPYPGGAAAGNSGLEPGVNTGRSGGGSGPCSPAKAKLVFFDLAGGTGDGAEDSVSMPGALQDRLYPPAYEAGARVSSNSWGGSHGEYNNYARVCPYVERVSAVMPSPSSAGHRRLLTCSSRLLDLVCRWE